MNRVEEYMLDLPAMVERLVDIAHGVRDNEDFAAITGAIALINRMHKIETMMSTRDGETLQ